MSGRSRGTQLLCASLVLLPLVTGCFQGTPELALVTGTVTLDGEPLANAQVEFQPTRGSPSYGTTNSLGQYELKYTKDKPGAAVGTHVVRITTQTTALDESGNEIQIPQRVPERYNYRSDLIRRVESGENRFDFPLESEPEPEKAVEEKPEAAEEPGEEKPEAERPGAEKPKAEAPQTQDREAEKAATQEAEAKTPGEQEPEPRAQEREAAQP